ncbi:kinesin motor domain-containing protein [Sporodiniella umbellata]|nr:kinesin motor domain-containing protein [Sporodiniella umbellata]
MSPKPISIENKEPIQSYLRIRPQPPHYEADMEEPYLSITNDLEISMTPPEDSNAYRTRNRAPEKYRFTRIFTESTSQQDFFNRTALPLIRDVLKGENALAFAYGVTNSGKTYSIIGTQKQPGLLPRTLDVIFQSVEGFQSQSKVKPCMHSLVQSYSDEMEENREIFERRPALDNAWENRDRTFIPIEENFEYGIWLSFAEIYTEKIYDLLVPPNEFSKRRQPLALKYEYSSGHKYISGLKEVRVQSIEEAYTIMLEGQRNRAEYSTLINPTSSRSHSIFTIRIVRVPIDENDYVIEDPIYATVSKFSIVDLAGSERIRNTLNFGQRLKEAGNINKSLMVLGQCMETLRHNQIKIAAGKKPMMVPYRHSKLTELFKSSFEGDGKAVMVVNVNPFDTGFDENSHVMKFAAVAKDVTTLRKVQFKHTTTNINSAHKRLRTSQKLKKSDQETDEIAKDEEDEEDEEDPFVDNLIVQLEDLRNKHQWIESEARNANMEIEITQRINKKTKEKMKRMENFYLEALEKQNNETESQFNGFKPSDDKEGHLKRVNSEKNAKQNKKVTDVHKTLSDEISQFRTHLNEQEEINARLSEKLTRLEGEKQEHQEHIRRLYQKKKEQEVEAEGQPAEKVTLEEAKDERTQEEEPRVCEETSERMTTNKSPLFEKYLELRKKLRRSIFRGEEYSHDADVIMEEIEGFPDVTFELVKETNMGKLLKLITQRGFKNDPYNIKLRAKTLFKKYAKISVPVLASKKPSQMVAISVDAGNQDEFLSDMRGALQSLQDENTKLKYKIKTMQEGHKRLKEAFEKTRSDPAVQQEINSAEFETHNSASEDSKEESSTLIDDEIALPQPRQIKRKRLASNSI